MTKKLDIFCEFTVNTPATFKMAQFMLLLMSLFKYGTEITTD